MLARVVVAIVLLLLPDAAFAQAEKRIALLIGNKDYKAGVGSLTNPLNDVHIVGDALKSVGFEVLRPVENAQRSSMLIAIHAFAAKLKTAGPDAVGFLYYSGHGIASAGENYLIPTDVDEPSTVLLSVQGVKQSEVLAILRGEAPNAAHYLVLDACRNTLQGARGGKGFMPVGQQSGVLVAFAAEPGKTASDTGQGSGPYAAALAAELVKPGQSDLIMFHKVRVAVMDKTNGDQVPWTEDGIQRRDRVLFGGEGKPGAAPPAGPARLSAAAEAWSVTKDTTNVAALEAFIARYKDSYYADLARLRIEELQKQLVAVASPPPKAPTTPPAAQLMPTRDLTIALLQNTEIIGSTRTFSGEQPDPDACLKQCLANASCHAFSFNTANRFCYLIDGVLSQQAHASYVSGMRRSPAREHNISRSGASREAQYSIIENIEILGSSRTFSDERLSLDACSKQCLADPSCQAFSFDRSNRFCYLIDGVTSLNSNPSFVSGRVR
jgi:Caspase domain/PAN domain